MSVRRFQNSIHTRSCGHWCTTSLQNTSSYFRMFVCCLQKPSWKLHVQYGGFQTPDNDFTWLGRTRVSPKYLTPLAPDCKALKPGIMSACAKRQQVYYILFLRTTKTIWKWAMRPSIGQSLAKNACQTMYVSLPPEFQSYSQAWSFFWGSKNTSCWVMCWAADDSSQHSLSDDDFHHHYSFLFQEIQVNMQLTYVSKGRLDRYAPWTGARRNSNGC